MNHMITGDDGSSPASPYYREPNYKCENCYSNWELDELTNVDYVMEDEPEDAKPDTLALCPKCVKKFENHPKIVIL